MAGGSAYKSPEKSAKPDEGALPGQPQDAWPGTKAGPPGDTKGTKRPAKRRNSIMELLDEHGDSDKQLITRAGFEALCDHLGLRLNTIEMRRAFTSLDNMDGTKDGQLEYSYVRPHPPPRP
jgi:hypothetical protein